MDQADNQLAKITNDARRNLEDDFEKSYTQSKKKNETGGDQLKGSNNNVCPVFET